MNTSVRAMSNSGAPPVDSIKSALERLLSDGKLKLSERNRRFLSFVVSETLAGRGERIKAYTIAVDVFGRGLDFDPISDPIVRIEATRLRSALSTYYEHMGRNEQVRILIPPGGYVPQFSFVDREHDSKRSDTEPSGDIRPLVIFGTQANKDDQLVSPRVSLLMSSVVTQLKNSRLRLFVVPSRDSAIATKAIDRIMSCSDVAYSNT